MIRPLEGGPKFSNPLAESTNPYLRQHAKNPVYWMPWSKAAIEKAREDNKPIFLSIGYSSCYWCHVMEREVFDNVSIAAQMNRWFVNIKVDREEMPEIDELYMVARQMITQQGGWPNNLFLTPDLKPFYALGTAPAGDGDGKTGFPRVLEWVNFSWQTQEEEIRKAADDITENMRAFLVAPRTEAAGHESRLTQAEKLFTYLRERHDNRSGGFFATPKFPHESYLQFLMDYYELQNDSDAMGMVNFSLEKMAAGGINDQVGCGWHRYAIDKEWYVPHFEKMLYTQAQMATVFLEAFRHTDEPYFADMARAILDFCSGPFTTEDGAFYSSFDAEVGGIEGHYYTWTAEEIQELLTEPEVRFFTRYFALADVPHFPGHPPPSGQTIIARQPFNVAARESNMPYVQFAAFTGLVMNKLLTARNTRESPKRDDKVIVGWNGLMIDAYARAGAQLNYPLYTEIAAKAARFIMQRVTDINGNLARIWIEGKAEQKARLEDYAFFIRGLLSLYRTTKDEEFLAFARTLMGMVDEKFADANDEGWFTTEEDDLLVVRMKTADDSAVPSANAVMMHNLIDFYEITQEEEYLDRAEKLAEFFSGLMHRLLIEAAVMMSALLRLEKHRPDQQEAAHGRASIPFDDQENPVSVSVGLYPASAKPGEECEVIITMKIDEGWYVQSKELTKAASVPTTVDVRGPGVADVLDIHFPTPTIKQPGVVRDRMIIYEGNFTITSRIKLSDKYKPSEKTIHVELGYQACRDLVCTAPIEQVLSV